MVHTRAWPRISPSTKIYFRCHFSVVIEENLNKRKIAPSAVVLVVVRDVVQSVMAFVQERERERRISGRPVNFSEMVALMMVEQIVIGIMCMDH